MKPLRSEIWLVRLDPTVGDEMRKTRPAIVVNDDAIGILALRVVVPLTEWQAAFTKCAWIARLEPDADNRLAKTSAADAFQVRSVALARFARRIGTVGVADFGKVLEALKTVFDL